MFMFHTIMPVVQVFMPCCVHAFFCCQVEQPHIQLAPAQYITQVGIALYCWLWWVAVKDVLLLLLLCLVYAVALNLLCG